MVILKNQYTFQLHLTKYLQYQIFLAWLLIAMLFGSGDFSQIVSGKNDQFGSNDFNQCNNRYDAKVVSLCRESHLKARGLPATLVCSGVAKGLYFRQRSAFEGAGRRCLAVKWIVE